MSVAGVVGSIQNHFTVWEYKANVGKKEKENGGKCELGEKIEGLCLESSIWGVGSRKKKYIYIYIYKGKEMVKREVGNWGDGWVHQA